MRKPNRVDFAPAVALGCQPQPVDVSHWVVQGEYGRAREEVRQNLVDDRSDRMYLLDRMRLGILTLDDGYPRSAQNVFSDIYEILRTQGINKDKTVASVVLNEDIKFWKGEPFEQAMAFYYYSVSQAMLGSWDNARAAAGNSLFYLRDFGADDEDQDEEIDTLAIAHRSLEHERALSQGQDEASARRRYEDAKSDYLATGYAVRESNFTLGYLMNGLANLQLGREDEARDHLKVAVATDPMVDPVCRRLIDEQYNTVLVVAYGLGPMKVGYGPDRALAAFDPIDVSDDAALNGSRIDGQSPEDVPGRLRRQHDGRRPHVEQPRGRPPRQEPYRVPGRSWRDAIMTDVALHQDSGDALAAAGIGLMLAGMYLKAGAHVDTRYCDVMPQRLYLVPVIRRSERSTTIELQVQGKPRSRMVLAGLQATLARPAGLGWSMSASTAAPPPPATTGNGRCRGEIYLLQRRDRPHHRPRNRRIHPRIHPREVTPRSTPGLRSYGATSG